MNIIADKMKKKKNTTLPK